MQDLDLVKHLFRTSTSRDSIICPPDQVFINPYFQFLIIIGGHIADNAEEYNRLRNVLKEIGEIDFCIVENLGATLSNNDRPYINKFPLEDTYEQIDRSVKEFDPPFGFYVNHFYVCGRSKNWGIYICEYPTIKIIGCTSELTDKFAAVFNIRGNGFLEVSDFIEKEYHYKEEMTRLLIENYRLV